MSTTRKRPVLSLLVGALVLASPSTSFQNNNPHRRPETIGWGALAMSPAAEVTAAVVRRNMFSGAAIFTVGDAAAQLLTSRQTKKRSRDSLSQQTPVAATAGSLAPEGMPAAAPGSMASPRSLPKNPLASLDMNRLGCSTVLGAIWSGFCVPLVYGTVEKTFPGKADFGRILLKVLVTCSILSTIGNYVTMLGRRFLAQCTTCQFDKNASLRLEWRSRPIQSMRLVAAILRGCFRTCNRDIAEVILDDIKIWPIYDMACYGLIPPTWRPITTSIMSSGWAMYMSVVSAREDHDDEEEESSVDAKVVSKAAVANEESEEPVTAIQRTIKVTPVLPVSIPKATIPALANSTKRMIGVTGGTLSAQSNPAIVQHHHHDGQGVRATSSPPPLSRETNYHE